MIYGSADISAVVCTLDSIATVQRCLSALRLAGVGEIIVVDGGSSDGTRDVAAEMADVLLEDPGKGLGVARNIGIAHTSLPMVLNCGSDNVVDEAALAIMIDTLHEEAVHGVSALTRVEGGSYLARSMNDYRAARFRPGRASVIGTPSLFLGDLLRGSPYDPHRRFSDDSELCERWRTEFGSSFAISPAEVLEIGKATIAETRSRCKIYGISDDEVYQAGVASGWDLARRYRSLMHPARVDLVEPLIRLGALRGIVRMPFLLAITSLRYAAWRRAAVRSG